MSLPEKPEILITPTVDLLDSPEYLSIIEQVSKYFKRKWDMEQHSVEDLFQDVYLVFKERQMAKVVQFYDANAGNFEDYFRRAVYNKCRELLRARQVQVTRTEGLDASMFNAVQNNYDNPESETIWKETLRTECYKIDMFIQLLTQHKDRLILLLKLYARLILSKNDLLAYYKFITKSLMNRLILVFGINYASLQDQMVMEHVFPLIQAKEPEVNQVSSLRRWLDRQITKLTDFLNKLSPFNYEHQTLRSALMVYFKPL